MRLVCERGHTNQDGQRQSNEKRLHVRPPLSGVKHRWLDRAPRARCSFCKPVLPALGIGRMSPRFRFVSFVSGLAKTMRWWSGAKRACRSPIAKMFQAGLYAPRLMALL